MRLQCKWNKFLAHRDGFGASARNRCMNLQKRWHKDSEMNDAWEQELINAQAVDSIPSGPITLIIAVPNKTPPLENLLEVACELISGRQFLCEVPWRGKTYKHRLSIRHLWLAIILSVLRIGCAMTCNCWMLSLLICRVFRLIRSMQQRVMLKWTPSLRYIRTQWWA